MIPRIVFDTNVLVSGLLVKSTPPAQAFDLVLSSGEFIVSPELVVELSSVLRRTVFDAYVSLASREAFLTRFVERATLLFPLSIVSDCRDLKDNHLLALALDGKAQYLVTGDNDLLVLNPFRGIDILNPADFLKRVSL